MANRNFANGGKVFAMHVSPVLANVNITIGASGAVSSFVGTLSSSVTRISAGLYQINMTDPYVIALFASGAMQSPVSGVSGIVAVEIQNAPSSTITAAGGQHLQVKCLNASDALTDPASGSVLSLLLLLNNSSVKA